MTYRKMSYEQMQKRLDDMREEKAAAVERVQELEEKLKNRGRKTTIKQSDKLTPKGFGRTTHIQTSGTYFESKRWMKVGAVIILSLIALPLIYAIFVSIPLGVYLVFGFTFMFAGALPL